MTLRLTNTSILILIFVLSLTRLYGLVFPLRAVVPNRRGWHWVKWLGTLKVVA